MFSTLKRYSSIQEIMPFSDDEQIVLRGTAKQNKWILSLSICIFILSLFNVAYYTPTGGRFSVGSFFFGWVAMFVDGASLVWLANPFLFLSWYFLKSNRRYSVFPSLAALTISLLFLRQDKIIDDEAGNTIEIVSLGYGYWMWLLSSFLTFIGSLALFLKVK